MQVLKLKWGMTRGTSSVVMSFICETCANVIVQDKGMKKRDWNQKFGGCCEVLL